MVLPSFQSFWRKKAGEWTKKAENRQEGGDRKKRNKAETKGGIEKREFQAQNF